MVIYGTARCHYRHYVGDRNHTCITKIYWVCKEHTQLKQKRKEIQSFQKSSLRFARTRIFRTIFAFPFFPGEKRYLQKISTVSLCNYHNIALSLKCCEEFNIKINKILSNSTCFPTSYKYNKQNHQLNNVSFWLLHIPIPTKRTFQYKL